MRINIKLINKIHIINTKLINILNNHNYTKNILIKYIIKLYKIKLNQIKQYINKLNNKNFKIIRIKNRKRDFLKFK